VDGSIAWRAMEAGHGMLASSAEHELGGIYDRFRPDFGAAEDVMALPLVGADGVQGAVVAVRTTAGAFDDNDLEMADGFAGQAAVALQLASARREQQRLTMLSDRARIARDLHDHVVQKLFAVGLTLQSAMSSAPEAPVGVRLAMIVGQLDETIRSLRNSIFELQTPAPATTSLRSRLLAVLAELAPVLVFSPSLEMAGPLEVVVHDDVAVEVEAVLREALANVALHAEATSAQVRVATDGRTLVVSVSDDGNGVPAKALLSGLAELRTRGDRLGAELELGRSPEGGVLLTWTAPV
jgi:signal transduction histidine kinase